MNDWRGTEIEVGDTILYSVKESTEVSINEAIVYERGETPRYSWSDRSDTVPYVKAVWFNSNGGEWARKQRSVYRVTLRVLNNITVIKKGNVSVDTASWRNKISIGHKRTDKGRNVLRIQGDSVLILRATASNSFEVMLDD